MDKRRTPEEMVAEIPDGATVAIGGSSVSRKPMALVRALARSPVRDLTVVVDIGGPDVEILIAAGKVRRLIYAYVGFEAFGLAPHFRRARETRALAFEEWTEYTVLAGLDAAVKGVPFLPTRATLGTDVERLNPSFRRLVDPFGGEPLVAVPALRPDVALLHVNVADPAGYGVILGDAHGDVLMAKAAKRTFLTAESVVPQADVLAFGRDVRIARVFVAGVAEAPLGAHPTGLVPYYRFDAEELRRMQELGRDPAVRPYLERFVGDSEAGYLSTSGGAREILARLAVP